MSYSKLKPILAKIADSDESAPATQVRVGGGESLSRLARGIRQLFQLKKVRAKRMITVLKATLKIDKVLEFYKKSCLRIDGADLIERQEGAVFILMERKEGAITQVVGPDEYYLGYTLIII